MVRCLLFIFISCCSALWAQQPGKIKVAKEVCVPALLERKGGNITQTEVQNCDSIFIKGACNYKILSYQVVFCFPGSLREIKCYEKKFSAEIKDNLRKLEIGNRFFIEEIW
jgi:hypothetical protein